MGLHEVAGRSRIFIDLDGTLLNVRYRLHGLFQELVPRSSFSLDEYWEAKRSGRSHREILSSHFSYSPQEVLMFEREWLAEIEEPRWLRLDSPYPGVSDRLADLREHHGLHLLTARQRPDRVRTQIEEAGWSEMFESLLVTGRAGTKLGLLQHSRARPSDWIIGDTGMDVESGRAAGVRTAVVTEGSLRADVLARYRPERAYRWFREFEPE